MILTIPQKDKVASFLGDVGRTLYDDPRRYTYDDIDEFLTILASRGFTLELAEKEKKPEPAPTTAEAKPAPAVLTLTTGETALLDDIEASVKQNELIEKNVPMQNRGYRYRTREVRFLIKMLNRIRGIEEK
jgi:hypothetical protein